MMKKRIMFIVTVALYCIIPAINLFAQSPCSLWGLGLGSAGTDQCYDIKHQNKDFFVCGEFSGTLSFNNGTQLISSGMTDIFLAKFDSAGNNIWAIRAGGPSEDRAQELAIDNQGNIYFTGEFSATSVFGTETFTSFGDRDVFTSKVSVNGAFVWTKVGGSYDMDNGRAIAVNSVGEVYSLGFFFDTAQFGNFQVTSMGVEDIFLAKYSSSGALIWITHCSGEYGDDPRGIDLDANGNIYFCGYFTNTISLPGLGQPLVSHGGRDSFYAKFNNAGSCLYAKAFGSNLNDTGESIKVTNNNDIYIAGYYSNNFLFGGQLIQNYGDFDAYLAKFSATGQELWIKTGNSPQRDYTTDLDITPDGNLLTTGYFQDVAQFDSFQIASNGSYDVFTAFYSPDGEILSANHFGGIDSDISLGISSSADGNWVLAGSFMNSMLVNNNILVSNGSSDMLLIGTGVSSQSADFAFSANNLTVDFTLTSAAPDSLRWDFGDGTYSTMTNPQHTYPSYNSFEVTLTAYFPCNTDTASHTVVLCTLPVSAFTYEKDYLFVQFNNSTTFADSVLWQFGDGSVSTQNNPSHLYASAGNYNVNLISFNSCGNDTAVVSMVVCDQMVSDFEFTIQENLVLFTNLSSGFFNVLWDFGDGTTSTLLNPEHEYPASGDFVVQLYCYSPCDTMVSVDTVTVCLLPVPAFTYSFSGDMTYQFINQSTDYLTCMWYFGDGDSSSLQNPVHTYNSGMIFPVQLVLYNNCGTASITDSINLITDIFEITNDPVIVQTTSNGNIMINIKEPDGIQDLFLYDLKGSLRYKTQIQTSVFINTNSYNSGLYILRIINNNKELFKRKICITH